MAKSKKGKIKKAKLELKWKSGFYFAADADVVKVDKELAVLISEDWQELFDNCDDDEKERLSRKVYAYAKKNRKSEVAKCFSQFSGKRDVYLTLGLHEARQLINHVGLVYTSYTGEEIKLNAYSSVKDPKTNKIEYIRVVDNLHKREEREAIFNSITRMLQQVENKLEDFNKLTNMMLDGEI